jgi:hypothetical protein
LPSKAIVRSPSWTMFGNDFSSDQVGHEYCAFACKVGPQNGGGTGAEGNWHTGNILTTSVESVGHEYCAFVCKVGPQNGGGIGAEGYWHTGNILTTSVESVAPSGMSGCGFIKNVEGYVSELKAFPPTSTDRGNLICGGGAGGSGNWHWGKRSLLTPSLNDRGLTIFASKLNKWPESSIETLLSSLYEDEEESNSDDTLEFFGSIPERKWGAELYVDQCPGTKYKLLGLCASATDVTSIDNVSEDRFLVRASISPSVERETWDLVASWWDMYLKRRLLDGLCGCWLGLKLEHSPSDTVEIAGVESNPLVGDMLPARSGKLPGGENGNTLVEVGLLRDTLAFRPSLLFWRAMPTWIHLPSLQYRQKALVRSLITQFPGEETPSRLEPPPADTLHDSWSWTLFLVTLR